MPGYTRDIAHSIAAAEKLLKERVGGRISIFADIGPAMSTTGMLIVNAKSSPNLSARIVIAAALAVPNGR